MQIDFHFGVTYIVSRIAGFKKEEAQIIAYSAQFVDDAIHDGMLKFTNRASYQFISSAHKMLDYRNFKELANKHVWIPFHFLPGNQIEEKYSKKVDDFLQRLVCRPNSSIAKDLVNSCIENNKHDFSLHLLGVTMHTFADTWAHQGFCGIISQINKVGNIYDSAGVKDEAMLKYRDRYFKAKYVSWINSLYKKFTWEKLKDIITSLFLNEWSPIGHGCVLSYPDLPFKRWQYENWDGSIIERNNPKDFFEAVVNMIYAMKKFRGETLENLDVYSKDLQLIAKTMEINNHEDSEKRLEVWINMIRDGKFSFGPENCNYEAEGSSSWTHEALGFISNEDFQFDGLVFTQQFMKSHWKFVHDAIAFQKFNVLNVILPKYGISVN